MSTWLNRGASGGLAGAWIKRRFQATANSQTRLTHRISDTPWAVQQVGSLDEVFSHVV